MANKLVAMLEQKYLAQAVSREIPYFTAGDTVVVTIKIKDGDKSRLQAFEGFVIAKRNRGYNSAFTVRKFSHGIGVERVFQVCSPFIDSVVVKRRGDVRRAKLYYMRQLSGKAARIKEKLAARPLNTNSQHTTTAE